MQPGDEHPSMDSHWSTRVDWAGLSVFVLAAAVGVAVVVVVIAEMNAPAGGGVLVPAMSTVLGAMVGAVSTYVGLFRRTPAARHRRDEPAELDEAADRVTDRAADRDGA